MYRAAPASESKNLSIGALNSGFLRLQVLTASNTMTKAIAFIANTTLTPANGIRRPPRAGPMVPARFIWIPPRAIAEGSCSFPTISGIEEEATGAWNANPVPSRKTPARMTAGVNPPRKAQQASKPALHASHALEMRSS
jgi:hypothetical protein